MNTYKRPYGIFLLGIVLILSGCVARNDPLFSKHIKAADQAIEQARKRGVDKQDPAKFRELVKLRDDAEKRYMACFYYEARDMTKQVVAQANALKGPTRVVERVPAPVPVKASVPKSWKFDPVLFDFDRVTIQPKFFPILDRAAFVLKSVPELKMNVEGHADNVGTAPYNRALSKERANAVVNYLVNKGVSRERLSPKWFGEGKPSSTNDTEKGRSQNRRVELKPVGKAPGGSPGKN